MQVKENENLHYNIIHWKTNEKYLTYQPAKLLSKIVSRQEKSPLRPVSTQRNDPSNIMTNQGNMGAQKVKSPETKLTLKKDCDLNYREFKTVVMKMLNEIQRTQKGRQINDLRKKLHKRSILPIEIETIKNNPQKF